MKFFKKIRFHIRYLLILLSYFDYYTSLLTKLEKSSGFTKLNTYNLYVNPSLFCNLQLYIVLLMGDA